MNTPMAVALDTATPPGIYVADMGNNRVLHFAATSNSGTNADGVYGQAGYTTCYANKGPDAATNGTTAADTLKYPSGLAVNASGDLYVADYSNNRVLYYPATAGVPASTATRVYGQSLMSGKNSAHTASTLYAPQAIGIALDGSIYVADSSNNRVLHYAANPSADGPAADYVFGQADMICATANYGSNGCYGATSIAARTLSGPTGVAVASDGGIYVADGGNSRALYLSIATEFTADVTPGGAAPTVSFTTQPSLTFKDVNGNTAVGFNGTVTVAIKSGTGTAGAVLSGTTTVTVVAGIATFTDLSVDLEGTGYVLEFIADGFVNPIYSSPFDVGNNNPPPPPPGGEVIVVHSADLVPQLRVSPGTVGINPENLVSFAFKVKNIGRGNAGNLAISIPVPQGLDVGYLDGAGSGVWVKQVSATGVTIGLPNLENGSEASGTLMFRPNANAVAGTEVVVSYSLSYDDETKGGKNLNSNSQSFVFGEASSTEEGNLLRGAAVSAIAGEKVSITQTGYLADELVAQWYTAPDGTTVSLGMHRANADGVVTIAVNTAGLSGSYSVVGYGNRSEVTHVNILTVAAS